MMIKASCAAAAAVISALAVALPAWSQAPRSAADIQAEAEATAALAKAKAELAKTETAAATAEERKTIEDSFAGFKFGVGLSLTIDDGLEDRITSASVVNGIVRVDNQDNAIARVMLETHYFFTPEGCLFGLGKPRKCWLLDSQQWGWGPFIAAQPGEGDIIDAIGAGIMLGFRRPGGKDSFNFGVGGVVDPNARILGDGIEANEPLPAGETEIRFKEKEQWGWVVITSYTF